MASRDCSLVVCMTPLHVLIVGAIARSERMQFKKGLFIATSDNKKSRFYADKMREFCESTEFVVTPPDSDYGSYKLLKIWYRRLSYRLSFNKLGRYCIVFVPSSVNHYLYALLSACRPEKLHSYDDGLLNIQRNSPILTLKTSKSSKLFYFLAGICYWNERVVTRSATHYTIYDASNACSNLKRIRLYAETFTESEPTGRVVTLLLGPPPEASASVWSIVEQASVDIFPDFYLPHPRDQSNRLPQIPRLDTIFIVEDYAINALLEAPGLRFRVFGFESSALVNLASVAGVSTYTLMPESDEYVVPRQLMFSNGVLDGCR